MPIDKNKQEGFSILNECLRDSHKRYHYDTLLEEVNRQLTQRDIPCISIRTLKNDINQMVNEYDVELDESLAKEIGLNGKSVIKTTKLYTGTKSKLGSKIGDLPKDKKTKALIINKFTKI